MAETKLKIAGYLILVIVCGLFPISIWSQSLSKNQVNIYVNKIAKLRMQKKLTKYAYPHKSWLGALYGYYSEGELVYIEAIDGGDTLENRYYVYLKENKPYKAIVEHFRYNRKYVETGKKKKLIYDAKTEVFYPKDLIVSNLLEGIETGIGDLKREKELLKY